VNAVVPKLRFLNQLPVVIVGILEPDVSDKLATLSTVPPVVPNVNVLVVDITLVNPPVVLVQVRFVTSAIDTTVIPAVVCVKEIKPVLKIKLRTFVLLDENIPVDNVNPVKVNVPAKKLYVPVLVSAYDLKKVTLPALCVNTTTAAIDPNAPKVNVPEFIVKPVQLIKPLLTVMFGPVTTNVVQVVVPKLIILDDVLQVIPLVTENVNPAKFKVLVLPIANAPEIAKALCKVHVSDVPA
jgi:hypothetical protein